MNRFCLTLFLIFIGHLMNAQTREKGPWWPHEKWGPEDETGASNWITPETMLKALQIVKEGKVYELGHVYEKGMPLVGERSYNMYIPSWPTYGPFDEVIYMDDFVTTEIGQVGTQYDGPGHVGKLVRMEDGSTKEVFYNGFNTDDIKGPYGLKKLGIENVKPIVARGILVDLAAYKNLDQLEAGYMVTMDDVRSTLKAQEIKEESIEPGDVLLFNFGWWQKWPDLSVLENTPYLSKEVVEWIRDKNPSMVGSDCNLDGGNIPYVHTILTLENGIGNLESMKFDKITEDKVYNFLFIFTPLRFKGGTGSPGRPIAIY